LLIEDDLRAATVLREMLRTSWRGELVLTQVERLAAGSKELRDHGASCVLLDLTLPDGSGIAALDQIRATAPDVPIVALSDADDDELALEVLRHGAQDHLVKPHTDSVTLCRTVARAIERQSHEAGLAHRALHDSLTGLPNRALLMDRLAVALDRSRRTQTPVAVMFLDVDGFKQINDTHGHGAGDRVLIGLAERLRAMLRPMDSVARFGGDEFALLFEDVSSEREVVLIAERITHAARLPLSLDHGDVTITVSIGIAIVTDPAIHPETLILEADAAMYRAKERGPSHYELFDENSRRRAIERIELEAALRQAVERHELRVHYQPRIALEGEPRVTGFEALVRWEHPERGLIGPREFMPLAEETGLVIQIGEYVLDEALHQLGRWHATRPEVSISVNLSPRQLEDTGLVSMLARAIRSTDSDPRSLYLEVSESACSANPDASLRMLEAVKALGVRLAIDDYGTGSSSLSNLRRLPVDVLKIHESFVSRLGSDAGGSIVGAVVELAHALGLGAVAEGVETTAQLERLRRLGCDGAQGFLLGRPVPDTEAAAMLAIA
jgi:diguanylate cyclase (GGDEF)-like protein